jgi:glycolate oxidase iron-sulfur subunit
MQTSFAPEKLAEPQMAASEKILRTCVHCGFCTATCPTYLLLGDELDSPRGRIYLIKDMLENEKPATEQVVRHVDRCLSCLSCMTTCPSGVHYMHLVDHARAYIEETYKRPLADRLLRALLARILPNRALFRLALIAAWFGRPFAPLLARIPGIGSRLAAMIALAPSSVPVRPTPHEQVLVTAGKSGKRVVIMEGCAQPVLKPSINAAARRLIARAGIETVDISAEGCCGALVHHMGREHAALDYARRNIDAWTAEIEGRGLDAILITASGCGTTVKDYGYMLRNDPAYAQKAAGISSITKDISEYVSTLELEPLKPERRLTVAYHSACSMQHGQQIRDEPKRLLRDAGFRVVDVPEGHICCGSAGTYNILQPEIAGRLRARKVANIERTKPDIIATGNIGCITQISGGTEIPVVHTIELVDWARGGPLPPTLETSGFAR